MTDMPDPREFDECAHEGWDDPPKVWDIFDPEFIEMLENASGPIVINPGLFPCECGGQCDQCKGGRE